MRRARLLRAELDLWHHVWQQVETFLDRIESADDQDAGHRRKVHALLRAARAVEHQRAPTGGPPLSDPVVEALPTQWLDGGTVRSITTAEAWATDFRVWRLPGTDELELAVAHPRPPAPVDLEEMPTEPPPLTPAVTLPPVTDLFEIRVDAADPRHADSDGGLVFLRMPTYPVATGPATSPISADVGLVASVDGLFSMLERYLVALAADRDDLVRRWSTLCAARRAALETGEARYVGPQPVPAWTGEILRRARDAVAAARSNLPGPAGQPGALRDVAAAAAGAATAATVDAADLVAAATVIEEEGAQDVALPDLLRSTADTLAGRPAPFQAVAAAATALADELAVRPVGGPPGAARAALATGLDAALTALSGAVTVPPLLALPVEDGAVGPELDAAVAARVGLPDGTLRVLRALEQAFVAAWPGTRRWLRDRSAAALRPALDRFLAPFVTSLSALVRGGDAGFPVEGLDVAAAAPVGGVTLVTDAPPSVLPALDAVDAGQLAILGRDRPCAALVLGVGSEQNRAVLRIAPLRISLVPSPEAPGTVGLAPDGQPIGAVAPGLSVDELRRGLADDAAGDGLVEQTLAQWSRLALLLGSAEVERRLGGPLVPEPAAVALHALVLGGTMPARSTSLVVHGAPDAFWDRTGRDPEPRLARPGELVLVRGSAEPDEETGPAPVVQAVLEVDEVTRIPGSALPRLDTSATALLSTSPAALAPDGPPALLCRAEEDLALITLRTSGQSRALTGPITLRRDFLGFDAASLATRRRLPSSLLDTLGVPAVADVGLDRDAEFSAALGVLDEWTRYAR
jgi:hypothetical protein